MVEFSHLALPSIVGRRTQGVLPPRSGQSEAPEEPMWSSSATSPHCGAGTSGCSGSTLNPELWDASDVVPSDELRELISSQARAMGIGALAPVDESAPYGAGPARYWAFPNAAGTVGFISAMSNHFCSACNRLRLTADGQLRPCLSPTPSTTYVTPYAPATTKRLLPCIAPRLPINPSNMTTLMEPSASCRRLEADLRDRPNPR